MSTVKEQTGAGAGEVLDFLYLDPSDIIVTDHRMRKEFADTLELQEELKVSPGLLTAPFVNLNNQLICGEHRYRAMCAILEFGGRFYHQGQLVPEGKIPVQRASRLLTELETARAEFGENNFRTPLTWMEKQQALVRLVAMIEADNKTKSGSGEATPAPKPTVQSPFVGLKTAPRVSSEVVAKTAETFFGQADSNSNHAVRQALQIENAKKTIPELATALEKVKSTKEAMAVVAKFERETANKQKAQEVGKNFSKSQHQVHRGDCLEVMRSMEGGIFDVAIFDPPYGMGANTFVTGGSNHKYDDSVETFKEVTPKAIRSLSRVLKPAAHIYIFCDFDNFHLIKGWVQDASLPGNPWNVQRRPVIMPKTGGGIPPRPGFDFRCTCEYILYAFRGGKKNTGTVDDVLIPVPVERASDHGAAKQPAAIKQLLAHSCKAGERVIDPMAGSGSTLEAGHELMLKVTAIEMDETYYGMCLKRLEGLN